MGEQPYFPPNVSGWEGGLSWLNTDTALARFGFDLDAAGAREDRRRPGETPAAAYERAYVAVGAPWLPPATAGGDPELRADAPSPRREQADSSARSRCAR